jgi:hypothetical protein
MSGKTDRCMKNARFFVSADSTTWTEVAGAQIRQKDGTAIAAFRQAPGADSYGDYDTVDLGPGITARYVKIMTDGGQNSGNYGDNAYVGLAEVQVFGTLVSNPHDVLTDQITGVTATASTEWGGREAEHLTDNSGISGLTHDTNAGNMWMSGTKSPPSVESYVDFDLGAPETLQAMRVWNYNEGDGARVRRAMRTVDVYVSADATFDVGERVYNDIELLLSTAGIDHAYDNPQIIDLSGCVGQYVRITSVGNTDPNYGDPELAGLSEVQFFRGTAGGAPIPEPGFGGLLLCGVIGLLRRRCRS